MEADQKRKVMIALAVGAIAVAAVVVVINLTGSSYALKEYKGRTMWIKCDSCGASRQIPVPDYYEKLAESPGSKGLKCTECGKRTCWEAIKCQNCDKVFYPYAAGEDALKDRCPNCGFSSMEQKGDQSQ